MDPIQVTSNTQNVPAVWSENTAGGDGIVGKGNRGVVGEGSSNAGVVGASTGFDGVYGQSYAEQKSGVSGRNLKKGGFGVWGYSEGEGGIGVSGRSKKWQGVYGWSEENAGVVGESDSFVAIWAQTKADHPAMFAKGPAKAARFEGNVEVTANVTVDGDIVLTSGADCAEDFDIGNADSVEPGTVMVLGEAGVLHSSQQAYDRRVAGVLSGAGNHRPGIVLDKQHSQPNRKAIALLGKVYCKVDANFAPIHVGDLLTTSNTPGHAMKALDPLKGFGAIIGKALQPLQGGQGLIPILIALH
jgi:hypothetical protein